MSPTILLKCFQGDCSVRVFYDMQIEFEVVKIFSHITKSTNFVGIMPEAPIMLKIILAKSVCSWA